MSRRFCLIAAAASACAVVAAAAYAIGFGSSSEQAQAQDSVDVVVEAKDGAAVSTSHFTSAKAAAADASQKAGFTIVVPSGLPAGYQLGLIGISPPVANGLRRARLRFASTGQPTLTLLQVNTPFRFDGDDPDHAIATPGKGATIYRVSSAVGTEYTLLTPSHGYTLTVLAPEKVDQGQAVKILSALPLD